MIEGSSSSFAMRATARPWLPSVADTSVGVLPETLTRRLSSSRLGSELGSTPKETEPNFFAQQVQANEEMERHWSSVQDW